MKYNQLKNLFGMMIVFVYMAGLQTPAYGAKPIKASKERLVLMPLRVTDEDKNLHGAMETALVEGLQQKFEVFSGEQVSQKARQIFLKESRTTTKQYCDENRCMQDIAEAFQAELIAIANVTKRPDGYFLALSIQNIFDNKVVYSKSIPCENCNAYRVVEKLKELSGTLVQPTSQAIVNIEPQPITQAAIPERAINKGKTLVPFWVDEVISKFDKGNSETDNSMGVVVPKIAENGTVVPFFINLSKPIGDGDRLVVVVNDKHPAYIVTPRRSTNLSFLSGRVKMLTGLGNIRALIMDSNGVLKTISSSLEVTVGAQSFDDGEVAQTNPTFKSKSGSSSGMTEIKALISYPSSAASFIESVYTEFSDGDVEIILTPVASKNPFVGFKVIRPEKPGYKIRVKDNRGGMSTEEGKAY